jgi:hypothetical protein
VDQHLTLAEETAGKHGMGHPKGNMTGAATDNGTMGSRGAAGTMSGGTGTGATGSSGTAR